MADDTTEETVEDTSTTNDSNFLDMNDDDIANMSFPPEEGEEEQTSETDTTAEATEESTGSDDSDVVDDSESTTQDDIEEAVDSDTNTSDDSDDGDSDEQDADATDEGVSTDNSSEESDNKDKSDDSKVSAEADIKKLLSPFKANGKDIQVDNVDDAITLMKMGANYNKKMQALKPNLKLVKMLENANLLDEGKLSNLIDLSNKNPAAVKQLIKDSGVDPLDIDVNEDTGYTPSTYTVNDAEVELDLVLADLKDTPKFNETMDVISNKFDAASKKVLVDSPDIIRVISEHVELGVYDKISGIIDRERMLGRLTGLNDIQAYKQVSDYINAKGGFVTDSNTQSEKADPDTNTAIPKDDGKTKARKKAAAPTRSSPGKKKKDDFNPLSMSDEDIENMPVSKYM